jgi:hypothetical protein
MAWVQCQAADAEPGVRRIWDRLGKRRWVDDSFVATGTRRFQAALPRCATPTRPPDGPA